MKIIDDELQQKIDDLDDLTKALPTIVADEADGIFARLEALFPLVTNNGNKDSDYRKSDESRDTGDTKAITGNASIA